MKKKWQLLPLLLLLTLFTWAQTRTITGKVLAATDGSPLAKATISIKGGKVTMAGDDGSFTIQAPSTAKLTLRIHMVGYTEKDIVIGEGQNNLSITLDVDSKSLNELVVVGYSEKKRSELTSSITVVDAGKLKDVTSNDVGSMLQGKVAGLQVVNSSGVPGASAEIRLRGVSSVNASQKPLTVVDGIIGGNYDPNDVESITVLKDAAATAMYGSQANAGVILVTTKKAKGDKPTVEARITTGFRRPDFGSMKLMNGAQLYEYQKEFYRDYIPGATDNSYKIDLLKFYDERPRSLATQDYSWNNALFKPALMQNYYVSLSGKTDKGDYYTGISYYNEKGTALNTGFQRINVRAGSTRRLTNWLSFNNNINLSGVTGKSYDYMDVYYGYLNMPWDNPFDSAHKPVYVDGNSTFKWWSRDKVNPLHTIANSDHPYKGFDLNYDANINISINSWLSFASTNRFSASYNKSSTYYSSVVAGQYHGTGYLTESGILNYGGISNDLLKASFRTGKHSISGLAGFAWEGGQTELSGAAGRGLPLGLRVLDVLSSNISVNGSTDRSTIQSLIAQANYGYDNKYFLTASYRRDGSTAFQQNNRYGSFPAVSAAWLASNESFLQSKVVNLLKLRGGYGITGTQDIGASRYLGLYSLTTQYNGQGAATPLQLPSAGLTWESKHQANLGIDIGLFNRINLTVDLYRNITKNLLLQVSQPLSVGFETRWGNAGEIKNKGIEISLGTVNVQSAGFSWTTDFNISFNTNKLQNLPADFVKTGNWAISQHYQSGGNLYEFFMPKWLGVDVQTGAPTWEKLTTDNNGNITKRETTLNYAEATLQNAGSALPKYQGGITNTFSYKGVSLSVNAYYLQGNKVYSNNLRFVMNDGNEPYYNQIVLPKGYSIWTKPGDHATNPSPQNSASAQEVSTRYLKDGSFLSIRNATLAWALPKPMVQRLGMKDLTVSVSGDNLHTFTHFLGQDPQTTITANDFSTPGVSDFKYPNNRQFLFNINIRF